MPKFTISNHVPGAKYKAPHFFLSANLTNIGCPMTIPVGPCLVLEFSDQYVSDYSFSLINYMFKCKLFNALIGDNDAQSDAISPKSFLNVLNFYLFDGKLAS